MGWGKQAIFSLMCQHLETGAKCTFKVLLMNNKNLHTLFRWTWMIEFSRNFAWLSRFRRQQRLNEWR